MFDMSLVLILLRNSNETGDVTIKSNIQNKTEKKEKERRRNTFTVRKRNKSKDKFSSKSIWSKSSIKLVNNPVHLKVTHCVFSLIKDTATVPEKILG